MPVYDYDCPKCELIEEKLVQDFEQVIKCIKCGGLMTRLFSPPDPTRLGAIDPVAGPKRAELWQAYKDHKIRFRVDMFGNDMIEVVGTGERVYSNTMNYQKLREAYNPPPQRDSEEREIHRDHTGRRIWPESTKKKFFVGGG